MSPTLRTAVANAACIAALLAVGTAGARPTLNTCNLVTRAEASKIIGASVHLRQGQSIHDCVLLWSGKQGLTTITAYSNPPSGSQTFQAIERRLHGTPVGGLGDPAFDTSQAAPGFIHHEVWVLHHGWVLQVTSDAPAGKVLSFAQLRALARIALRRF